LESRHGTHLSPSRRYRTPLVKSCFAWFYREHRKTWPRLFLRVYRSRHITFGAKFTTGCFSSPTNLALNSVMTTAPEAGSFRSTPVSMVLGNGD